MGEPVKVFLPEAERERLDKLLHDAAERINETALERFLDARVPLHSPKELVRQFARR